MKKSDSLANLQKEITRENYRLLKTGPEGFHKLGGIVYLRTLQRFNTYFVCQGSPTIHTTYIDLNRGWVHPKRVSFMVSELIIIIANICI